MVGRQRRKDTEWWGGGDGVEGRQSRREGDREEAYERMSEE